MRSTVLDCSPFPAIVAKRGCKKSVTAIELKTAASLTH